MNEKRMIGFYNKIIENEHGLDNCQKIFCSFDEMKQNIKENDCIQFKSFISLYDLNMIEILELKRIYNLKLCIKGTENMNNSYNNLMIQIMFGIMNYIKEEKTKFINLLSGGFIMTKENVRLLDEVLF